MTAATLSSQFPKALSRVPLSFHDHLVLLVVDLFVQVEPDIPVSFAPTVQVIVGYTGGEL